jgi:hypothetical protein
MAKGSPLGYRWVRRPTAVRKNTLSHAGEDADMKGNCELNGQNLMRFPQISRWLS